MSTSCRVIPVRLLKWLDQELDKLSKRTMREGEGVFYWLAEKVLLEPDERVALGKLHSSKPDSKYAQAATTLCEAAQSGEQVVLKLPEPPKSNSEYLGRAGEKLELDVEIKQVFTHNSKFGVSYIHKIVDTSGNELVWFSQGKKVEEGTYHMVAKAHKDKPHSEYYGAKQTRITHPKFEERRQVQVADTVQTGNVPDRQHNGSNTEGAKKPVRKRKQ
jgi:hypothetical protein